MNSPTLSPEQFADLHAGKPVEVLVGPGPSDFMTILPPEKKAGRRFRNVAELSAVVMKPVEFTTEFKEGELVTFLIRALDSNVAAEADAIDADVLPPKKKIKPVGPRGVETEELDWEDKAFLAAREKVNQLRAAFLVTRGLIEFEVPGGNLEEQNATLRAALPPRVIGALFNAIRRLTSDPVVTADFS